MFAFASAVTNPAEYTSVALEGIERVREGDSLVLRRDSLPLQVAANAMLDEAAREDGLEGLVLLHQDVEIIDRSFLGKLRRRFASDERIALVGVVGYRGVRSLQQINADGYGRVRLDIGGAERWWTTPQPWGAHEVDSIDGCLMAFSPWAVRELRFDLSFARDFHGYDVDLCFEARSRHRTVVVDELEVCHRHDGRFTARGGGWPRAVVRFDRKWKHRLR